MKDLELLEIAGQVAYDDLEAGMQTATVQNMETIENMIAY